MTVGAGRRERRSEAVAVLVAVASTISALLVLLGGETVTHALERPLLDNLKAHTFMHIDDQTGLPARFDPCRPIPYVINPAGAPAGVVDDVHEAILRVTAVTGLTFDFEGETDERPTAERAAYQPDRYGERWAPVLIAWRNLSADSASHHGDVLGLAAHTVMTQSARQDVIVTGSVTLATEGPAVRPGFGSGRRWGNVAMHELGHLVGLDHVDVRGQIMYSDAAYATGEWGSGDLAGLARLGRDGGCLHVPRPG